MPNLVSTRTCDVDGCDRKHCAKGLCRLHYLRKWEHDHPERTQRYSRAWYERHREEVLKKAARYREANPEYAVVQARANEMRRANYRGPDDTQWSGHLRRKYGITVEQYDAMLVEQGTCGICGADFAIESVKPCVDHCHETGRIRGFLCDRCNVGLGRFRDNPDLLHAALRWIA